MANGKKSSKASSGQLTEIKARLREGKLTPADIKKLQKIVVQAEEAAKALRAAMVE